MKTKLHGKQTNFLKKSRINIILVAFLLGTITLCAQTQIGQDIDGEAPFDNSGASISISDDGTIVAIGAHLNDGNGIDSGHVRVYQDQGGTWTQLGQDIDGVAPDDEYGFGVSLSGDGSTVALGGRLSNVNGTSSGQVRVYENQGGTWVQVGGNINGQAGEVFGISLSLSTDGSILAIGAPGNAENGALSGAFRVFENQSGTWTQIGQEINGDNGDDRFGRNISLSGDGSIVAVGAQMFDGNGLTNNGLCRVFENQGGTWVQVGQDIFGEASGDNSGVVSISENGTIVAIGALNNNDNGTSSGHVRIYENQNGTWVQIGQDIDGETANDNSGRFVSLSNSGSIVAIGSILNNDNGQNTGHARVFRNDGGNWIQVGVDIDGEGAFDNAGVVSISGDGNTLAVGAARNDDNGTDAGHVRVFSLDALLSVEDTQLISSIDIFPNPASGIVNISNPQGVALDRIAIYDITGRLVRELNPSQTAETQSIDITNLSDGLYMIILSVNNSTVVNRLVVANRR